MHVAARKPSKTKAYGTLADGFRHRRRSNNDLLQRPERGSLEVARCRILECEADAEFYELVKGNCDPSLLLIFLANLAVDCPTLDTWTGRFGFERRELQRVTKQLVASADDLECLERNGILLLAAWPSFKSRFDPVQFRDYVRSIPHSLRTFANNLDRAVKNPSAKPRSHTLSNTALAQLVAYVLHCTGTPHDKEVSALVDAVRPHDGTSHEKYHTYTADAHKTWRHAHVVTIHRTAQMFPWLFTR